MTVNFYRDEFVIATIDGDPKHEFVILDQNPWEENFSYYLVYIDETVDRAAYYQAINHKADVLHDGGHFLVLRIDENLHGQLPPAKNDGMVRISNKQVVLPVSMLFNSSGRFDPDPFIVDLMEEVSSTNITAIVQHLEDYGTRNCYKPESIEAQNWIKQQFESMGMDVEIQDFTMPNGPASDNVIATLVGTKYPDEFIVIGGHYDSIAYSGSEPGADDNASGTAGVMEVARILSQYEFDRTIIFCAFSGEEYGLYGSEAYADRCAQQGMNIHGYLNMDMIGYLEPGSYIHTDLIYPQSAQELADFYTQVCSVYLPDFPVEPGMMVGGDSDHTSFNNAGFMGIFPFEDGSEYSPYIHTSDDLVGLSYNNEEQAAIFTQAILATAVSMANRLTPPQNLVAIPGDGEVDLQWDPMYDVDYFNIYKDGELLTTTTDFSYHDEDVVNATQYEYYITAIYTDTGEESDPSNLVYATPMPPIALPLLIDFENGAPYWDFEDTWGISTAASHSPSHSISESPSGEYQNNQEIYATLNSVNLTGFTEASVSFWTKYDLESDYDYMWLEISTNGSTWVELDEYNGTQNSWVQKTYSLNDYLDEPYVKLRFHFYSDSYITKEGMFIDDFQINAEGGMMTQDISLPEGWSGFSSYIEPESAGIEDVLASIEDQVLIVQDMENVWWPEQNINTIGDWNPHWGYKIKLSEEVSLQMAGFNEAGKTISLYEGWNLMPVLSNGAVDIGDLFGDVMSDLVIIKEVAGFDVYWPEENISTLSQLTSGKAYLVKMNSDVSVTFSEITSESAKPDETNLHEGWDYVPPTGNSHVIAVPAKINIIEFEAGDIIGVFNADSVCAGYVALEDMFQPYVLVVSGNDSLTSAHDGFNAGETFSFKLYRPESGEEFNLIAGFDPAMPDLFTYVDEGMSKLSSLFIDQTGIDEIKRLGNIWPNPATEQISVSFDHGKALLEVINIKGQLVLETQINNQVKLNTTDLPEGIYTFRIISGQHTETHKVVIR
ncbi:MAG: M28 family peptidase [Bacteroidales bacterium]